MVSIRTKHIPIPQRCYKSITLKPTFDKTTFDRLRHRALRNRASPDGYIKRILNRYIELNTLPPVDEFNRLLPTTLHHPPDDITLASPFPPMYLRLLDTFIETLPPLYTYNGRTRRRMLETLVLIDLFN